MSYFYYFILQSREVGCTEVVDSSKIVITQIVSSGTGTYVLSQYIAWFSHKDMISSENIGD